MEKIEAFVRRLVDEYAPEKVILFGSYADGSATDNSDVDLLVVMPHTGPPARKSAEVRSRLRPGFALDLIVRSSEQLAERIAMSDYFLLDIVEKGDVLYESARAGVD